MVTQKVIKEIYKKYTKPPKSEEDLAIPHFIDSLKEHHDLECADGEIINRRLEAINPFSRMLVRRLNAILDFDTVVAFVFGNHIMFFDKHSDNMHIHFKQEKQSLLSRLFGRKN